MMANKPLQPIRDTLRFLRAALRACFAQKPHRVTSG